MAAYQENGTQTQEQTHNEGQRAGPRLYGGREQGVSGCSRPERLAVVVRGSGGVGAA